MVENNIRFCFTTYVRIKVSAVESNGQENGLSSLSETNGFEVKKFSFLPKAVLERHQEYLYLKLVEEIISEGTVKDDRTGTGTLSKFGCQVKC